MMMFKREKQVESFSPLVPSDNNNETDLSTSQCQYRNGFFYIQVRYMILIFFAALLLGTCIPHNSFEEKLPSPTPLSMQVQDDDSATVVNKLRHSSLRNDPRVAWLMSFPNSGTSYTLGLVASASNMTLASNYGWEHGGKEGISIPIFEGGPYWLDPDSDRRPTKTVLTKTHCGGYCHNCRVRKSVETPHSFLLHCATAEGKERFNESEPFHSKRHVYDTSNVDRAVHLIRDPLDNMVSRYHLGIHKVTKQNSTDLIERYTYTPEGFRNYCEDQEYAHDEKTSDYVDQAVLRLIKDIPCHLDLFRYVQWHNLAFIATNDFLQIPTHVLHYENYSNAFDETVESLLDFLELPNTGVMTPFETGKSYRTYYTSPQIRALRNATMRLALPITWQHLHHYLNDIAY